MAALTTNTPLRVTVFNNSTARVPVKASSTILQGSLVGLNAGYARAAASGSTPDAFEGIALHNGAVGGATDGVTYCDVVKEGILHQVDVLGASLGSATVGIGAIVYSFSDNVADLRVSSGTNTNVIVGKIHSYDPESQKWNVYFQAASLRSV
jgi:hypothetical protein